MPKENIRKVHEIRIDSHTTAAVVQQFVANDEAPAVPSLPPARPTRGHERRPRQPDVSKILAELKSELGQIDEAVLDLEGPATLKGHGRIPGSNDPGSQPPPAAPAAARIAGRLDRAVSGRKRPQGLN
jgi:hypothetical protein